MDGTWARFCLHLLTDKEFEAQEGEQIYLGLIEHDRRVHVRTSELWFIMSSIFLLLIRKSIFMYF